MSLFFFLAAANVFRHTFALDVLLCMLGLLDPGRLALSRPLVTAPRFYESGMEIDYAGDDGNRNKRGRTMAERDERAAPDGATVSRLPYRDLSEGEKRKIRAAVKNKSLDGLTPVEAYWTDIFLAKNAATGRGLAKGKRSGKGRYKRSSGGTKRSSRRAPTALSTVRRYTSVGMSGPVGDLHQFTETTAAFLQAVGSPFTPLGELPGGIMPRRPDPYFNGRSVAVHSDTRVPMYAAYPPTGGAGTPSNALMFCSVIPFGLGGLHLRGSQYLNGTPVAMPADRTLAVTVAWIKANVVPRLTAGQLSYNTYHAQLKDMSSLRVTAAGFKVHDVGQVLTQQGQFLAHKVNGKLFYESVLQQLSTTGATVPASVTSMREIFALLGIGGLMDYGTVSATYVATPAEVQQVMQNARQAAVLNAEDGVEQSAERGITIRYDEPRAEVEFMTITPLVFVENSAGTITEGQVIFATGELWRDQISRFTGAWEWANANMPGGGAPNGVTAYTTNGYAFYLATSTTGQLLLNQQFLPVAWVELQFANLMGHQGNSLLCIEATQMAKDSSGVGRVLNAYTSTWIEVQMTGTSALYSTVAPQDASYTQVVQLATGMPWNAKGFSFFKNLFEGVRNAARWIHKNQASIIRGVQAGVNVAGRLA